MNKLMQHWSTKMLLLTTVVLIGGMCLPARAALLVRYTFDEPSGGTTNAQNVGGTLGSNYDGVFNTASTGVATRTNNTPGNYSTGAISLTGTAGQNDFVGPTSTPATTGPDGLDALSTMTVSTWINVQSSRHPASFYVIASNIPGGGVNKGWLFYYNPQSSDTLMQLGLEVDASATTATANVNASNTWLFIAATWDTSNSELKFYSGTPTSAVTQVGTTVTLTTAMTANTVPLRLSGYAANPDTAPNALLDDFRVYDTVLDSSALETVRLENVPEPASLGILALGGLLLGYRRR